MTVGGVEAPDDGSQAPLVASEQADGGPGSVEFARLGIRGDAVRLAEVRRELYAWASTTGLAIPDVDGLIMASYEALANAAEHAYAVDAPRIVDLIASRDDDGFVQVVVRDYGAWRPEPVDPGFRGRGLLMIRNLAHDAEILPEPDGTTVQMRWRCSPDQ